jgi:outer membrane receptor protein involved in Fe transport
MSVSSNRKLFTSVSLGALALAVSLTLGAPAFAEVPRYALDIPSENAAKALQAFAHQSGVQIMFPYEAAASAQVPALKGQYTREEALKLILAHTHLEIASQDEKTVSLRVATKNVPDPAAPDEVVVVITGSHIRNSHPTSPVRTINRAEIEQSGYSQIGDVMRALPENFAGGPNPGVLGANNVNPSNFNATSASTVNIRGLGPDATLVLLNGHRLNNDSLYQSADISGIPLAAVQRVEVLTDGASALYGADAVAGVVNFVLRKDYDGGEASVRLGGATQGGGFEQTYSLLQGKAWSDAYALINVEYSNQTAIKAGDRAVTREAVPVTDLISPLERTSVFVAAGRDMSDRIKVGADVLFSQRDASQDLKYTPTGAFYYSARTSPSLSVSTHADFALSPHWSLRVTGGVSQSHNSTRDTVATATTTSRSISYIFNETQYAEATLSGPVFSLPSGDIQAAFGAGYRKDNFQLGHPGGSSYMAPSREIGYAFGELQVPVVSPSAERTGLNNLTLSLASRYEDYSDFGAQTSPKVGFRYEPSRSLVIRGTWGKSFKAPTFYQVYQPQYLYLYPASVLGYTGGGQALYTNGGNVDMKPERSESWTLGADYSPVTLRSLKLSATWFNIDYTDRVVRPITSTVTSLSNPTFAPFVTWSPSLALQSELVSRATTFYNTRNLVYNPSSVVAVAFNNFTNATAQAIEGADVSYRQTFERGDARLKLFLNATWLTINQKTVPTLPSVQLSGTIFNPAELKARGGINWERGGWSVTGIVNYVDGLDDTGMTPVVRIASWTTADATLVYRFEGRSPFLKGVRVSLSATNLFDRDPPKAFSTARTFTGFNYDSTNHSVIGRSVALTLSKSW